MSTARDRAVCVAFRDDSVLVVGRHKDGRSYCVLPGGGVEPGEEPQAAVLRELAEETGLTGALQRHLWTIEHHDRRAHSSRQIRELRNRQPNRGCAAEL